MQETKDQWNTIAADYDKKIVRGDFFRKNLLDKALIEIIGPIKNRAILDAGCGQGYFSDLLHTLGGDVFGVDFSESLIDIAKNRYKKIIFKCEDITEKISFEDNFFDVALLNMVLMDIEDPVKALKNVQRKTKNGAPLVISIMHPLFTSGKIFSPISNRIRKKSRSLIVNNYMDEKRLLWKIKDTQHTTHLFHRPMEYYINIVSKFSKIEMIRELAFTDSTRFSRKEVVIEKTPIFLLIKGIINK